MMVIVPPWTSAPQVKVTPSFCPVAADGGPTRWPSMNVPVGQLTAGTSGTKDSAAAYRSTSTGFRPSASGTTMVTAVSEFPVKSERSSSPT